MPHGYPLLSKFKLPSDNISSWEPEVPTHPRTVATAHGQCLCLLSPALVSSLMHGNKGRYKEEIFYNEDGETLVQVAQRGCRCPIPGNIQGQVGRGSEQPDLVKDVTAHWRGIGQDDL